MPQQRIRDKMDEYMSRRDYAGAERHLLYWLEEARAGRDERGRADGAERAGGPLPQDRRAGQGHGSADDGAEPAGRAGLARHISAGTTYVNVATAYNAFGENERAGAV